MIIETWRKPTLSCIFEILSHPTWDNDSVLRLYAIKHLSELPNEELLDYLPQLTQSLIYDPIWDSSRDRLKHVKSQETKAVPPQTARQKTQTTPVSPSQKEYTSDLTSIQSHSTSTSIDKLHQSKSFTGTVGNIQTHLDAMGTPLKVTGGRPTTSQSFSVNPTSSSYVGDGPRRESDQQTNEAMSEFESSTTSGRSNQGYSFTYDNVGKHVGLESDTDQVSVGAISAEDSARSDFTTERDRFDSEPHTESTQYRPPQPPSSINTDKISIFKSKVLPVLARFKADSTDTALESLVVDHGDRSTEWRSVEELNGKFGITQAMIDLSLARLREREERGQKLVSDEMIELAKREEEKERLAQQNKKEEEKDHNTLTEPLSQTEPIIADDAIPETLPTKNTTYDSSHPAQPRSSISDQTDSLEMNKERSIVPTHKQNLKGTGYDDTVISENDDLIFEPIEGEHHYDPAPLDSFVPPVELGIDEDSSQPEPSPYSPPTSSQMDLTRPAPIAPPSMPQIVLQGAKPSPPRRDDEQRRPGNQVEESNHSFMYKSLDDVRQDMLCVQIVSVFDRLFKSENLDLKLSPYQVVAIGANPPLGLIEFVPSKSIERIKLEDQSIANYFRSHNRDDSSPLGYPPEVLDNFIRSCAGYSVITFLLTVGDRHLDNLLVTPDGKMFHVDFGMFLGHDVKFRPSPMKLSKEMIDCMGGIESSHFGRFISLCCEAYSIARRKGANLILSLFRMMRKAKIPDLEDARGLTLVLMKFKLELTETEANYYMVQQIGKSTSAFFPSMVDKIHIFAQSWRN
ncbi:putative Phosphatidylinositol 3-kinase, root [Blattamonas nauphoetae]|uniref:Phosphatidylinositol 3-kinase, root n=1 Tax=Blattamonas nauphoetae TaxID=2049346 RepID=A0ABQ9YLA8_9EUKA|nr:putative Phosphatidylinositol 3-kinase, root [Blattamonas nauphoetae]